MKQEADSGSNPKMLNEYSFDYTKAKPNRFAEVLSDEQVVVVLDPDVAAVFHNSSEVNRVLRALIETMPHQAE